MWSSFNLNGDLHPRHAQRLFLGHTAPFHRILRTFAKGMIVLNYPLLTEYFLEFFNGGIKSIFKGAAVRTVYAFVGYDALESVPF